MKTIQPVCLKILFVISFLIWLQPDIWAQELRLLPLDSIIGTVVKFRHYESIGRLSR